MFWVPSWICSIDQKAFIILKCRVHQLDIKTSGFFSLEFSLEHSVGVGREGPKGLLQFIDSEAINKRLENIE